MNSLDVLDNLFIILKWFYKEKCILDDYINKDNIRGKSKNLMMIVELNLLFNCG